MNTQTQGLAETVIEINGVTRTFSETTALDNVSLSIPKGSVFGLVGTNGAGKTTLIKHVMGLLKAQAGSVSVFGMNPVTNPVEVLSRIGYMSEVHDLPPWMRVHQLLRYTQAFYPTWDEDYARYLQDLFELDSMKKVMALSKGQHARLALLLALAYRPDILVLDEPSSGLDPLVRRDILRAVIRTISDEGRTVLFSSHLLDEVERVSDYIAVIGKGKIVTSDSLENLQKRFHRFSIRLDTVSEMPPTIDGALNWTGAGQHWSAIYEGAPNKLGNGMLGAGVQVVSQETPSLEDIFVALVGQASPAMESHL